MYFNKLRWLAIMMLFFSSIFTMPVFAADAATKTQANVSLEFMFVQTGYEATLKKTKQPNTYTLTLHEVAPYVTYFSDRPKRVAGTFTVENFLQNWQLNKQNFIKDAPNADLVGSYYHLLKHKTVNLVVELRKPNYNAEKRTLTYTVKIINQAIDQEVLNKPFKHIVLFIDAGWCPGCDHGGLGL